MSLWSTYRKAVEAANQASIGSGDELDRVLSKLRDTKKQFNQREMGDSFDRIVGTWADLANSQELIEKGVPEKLADMVAAHEGDPVSLIQKIKAAGLANEFGRHLKAGHFKKYFCVIDESKFDELKEKIKEIVDEHVEKVTKVRGN